MAFSCHASEVFSLYREISLDGLGIAISHTTDPYTKRTALFSGLEVKRPGGNIEEAEAQLSIWLAAGLEKTRRLAVSSKEQHTLDQLQPGVGWTIVGQDWHTYIAYKVSENGREKTRVLGPIDALAANSRSYYGIFKVADLVKRVAVYGQEVYWPWLRDDILKPMVPSPAT
ncbi:hypothetical protein LTS18_005166 [Coniosporium uncinatum]|uniref:Uncharacterized protein n=1 Tax=Coniosporium uncinatum TaxID=93489 RepID=A0ACC3DB44_9PEZI|nr:hypothetical protein LTS18_005166 [Coniosporium uncinatum]